MSGDDPLERTFDTADTGLRNGIELATATHGLSSDENSALGGALEDHYKNIKTRNDRELKGELPPDGIRRQDRLRYSIRAAVQSAKQKAANPERQKTNGYEVPPGAPQLWSKDAKAEFDQAPHSVKMAACVSKRLLSKQSSRLSNATKLLSKRSDRFGQTFRKAWPTTRPLSVVPVAACPEPQQSE